MRNIFLLIFWLALGTLSSQEIKEIYIECDPVEFDSIYENYTEDIYIPAIITHDGYSWMDVLLRLRGDSSREYPKKSLKLQFDSEPFVNGKYTVNLNAEYHDLSYMHSFLSSWIFREAGIPSPDMEHVRVYLNGVFFGLYIMTENMDDQFLEAHGLNADGILYKASRDGACLSVFDNVFYHWELNNGSDPYCDQLTGLINGLNDLDQDFNGFVQSVFNYDNVTDFMALNMLISNGSTYYHNYFIFYDSSLGKWMIFPWDLDRTFSDYGTWYPYHRSSGVWTPDNPLLERSILDNTLFSTLKEKVDFFSGALVNQDVVFDVMDSIHEAIAASVLEDTTDNIPDLQTWQNKIALDKEFILNRYAHLAGQFAHSPSSFGVDRNGGPYQPVQELEFHWQESADPDGDPVTYIFYLSPDPTFEDPETQKVEGITETFFVATLPEIQGRYYWMVEATDGNAVVQGFDSRNELFVESDPTNIVINEINYNSSPDFDPGDWVELYNPSEEEVNLTGWNFKDEDDKHYFIIPYGTVIEAKGYLVLCRSLTQFNAFFPTSIPALGDLDFGFDGSGELLRLFDQYGYLVDQVLYRTEDPWPTEPDGNGPTLELLNPGLDNAMGYNWTASGEHGTPGAQNSKFSPDYIRELTGSEIASVMVYPNPCGDWLIVVTADRGTEILQIRVRDLAGRELISIAGPGKNEIRMETAGLKPGFYTGTVLLSDGKTAGFIVLKK